MNQKQGLLISSGLFFIGLVFVGIFLYQPVSLILNGKPTSLASFGLTPAEITHNAGFQLTIGDQIQPSADSLYLGGAPIRLNQISAYLIYLNGELSSIYATEPIPANVLLGAGIYLFPGDRVEMDGLEVNPQTAHEWKYLHTIEVNQSSPRRLILPDGSIRPFSSISEKTEDILWELGLGNEAISLQPVQSQDDPANNNLKKILTYKVVLPTKLNEKKSANGEIAEDSPAHILARTGQAPQGLDQINNQITPESSSLNGLFVQHIEETLTINQKSLPYQKRSEMDGSLELDQQKVTQAGQYGVSMELTRTRYRDGVVISENVEKETIIQPPVDEVVGYGTKVNVRTLDVGGKTIEYYRAISMYATSYSPCRSGTSKCSYGTASGETVRKGIVAVIPRWFAYMAGQQVYIPGYGFAIIGDTGGGIPGTNWIDLAYTDEEYVGWHSYVTVYFLTPVPENILYDIN